MISSKPCWRAAGARGEIRTTGGFPRQMSSLAQLFTETALMVPVDERWKVDGSAPLVDERFQVVPLAGPRGKGIWRQVGMLEWTLRMGPRLIGQIRKADVVHTPIPGDIGTVGMLLAVLLRKRLLVRHCGNWLVARTAAERFWRWFMERFAGGRNVMLATGGGHTAPSKRNSHVQWIFSTSLFHQEIQRCARERAIDGRSRLRLVCAGRQEPGKGTDIVIRAVALLANQAPEFTVEVVGDGAALAGLKVLAAKLGVSARVVFHGALTHARVLEVIAGADLFAFPTYSEGFPKVVVEALAAGLPILCTPVSVLPLLVEKGTGILLRDHQPETLAEALRGIAGDPGAYRRMSIAAAEAARQYTLENWRHELSGIMHAAWGLEFSTNGRSPRR